MFNTQKTYQKIVYSLKKYFLLSGCRCVVVGLSGGIDSSLTARIAVNALGGKKVYGLILPQKNIQSAKDIKTIKKFTDLIKIKTYVVYIDKFLKEYNSFAWGKSHLSKINTPSRIRATILYNFANVKNALVLGTSNKTELTLGYFTKYGDGACDVEVIGGLYKTEVYKMARYLSLPQNIISRVPTADLYIGQTDEKELGSSYEKIDKILQNPPKKETLLAKKLKKRIEQNKHKFSLPFVINNN